MVIVTAVAGDGGERSGCLVGFTSQASIHPPRFAVWISVENHTHGVAASADVLAVHFPTPDDMALASVFGEETGDEVDKFARCAWHEGPAGLPILDDLPNWFAGRILERMSAGDHDVFILDPIAAEREAEEAELTFHRAKRIEPGHAP